MKINKIIFLLILFFFSFRIDCILSNSTSRYLLFKEKIQESSTLMQLLIIKNDELLKYKLTRNKEYQINAKYLDFWIIEKELANLKSISKKLTTLFEIKSMSHFVYPEMEAESLYYLGFYIRHTSFKDLAIKYWNESIKLCNSNSLSSPASEIYCFKGDFHFENQEYIKSIDQYILALKSFDSRNYMYRSSMYNNIALCFVNLNQPEKAMRFQKKAVIEMSNIKFQNSYELFFKLIVDYTKTEIYFSQNKYKLAIDNMLPLYQFLLKEIIIEKNNNQEYLSHFIAKSRKLIELNILLNNKNEAIKITKQLIVFRNSDKQNRFISSLNELLIFAIDKLGINNNTEKILLDQIKTINNKHLSQRKCEFIVSNVTQKLLLVSEKKKAKLELEKKQSKASFNQFILLFVLLVMVLILVILINRYKFHREILEKNHEIVVLEKQQLEQENKLKEERLSKLNLNINLKNESERIFLEKIKEIRRSNKDKNAEDVLKDVQFKLKNLLEIDTKNSDIAVKSDESKRLFFERLLAKHPNLSTRELELCSHIRLGLSSKEIATIEDVVSGTIRVYKTKLKAKLGLDLEDDLNEYIQGFVG